MPFVEETWDLIKAGGGSVGLDRGALVVRFTHMPGAHNNFPRRPSPAFMVI